MRAEETLAMPVFWKSAALAAGLIAAYSGIQETAKVALPTTHLPTALETVGATRAFADSPIFAALSAIDGVRTWQAVLTRSGYMPTSKGAMTILVPSDAAFESGADRSLVSLFGVEDTQKLAAIVERTIIDQAIEPAQFAGRKISATTVAGNKLTLDATDQSLMVGDAEILAVRHASDGSVIYIVDHLPTNVRSASASDEDADDTEHHE
jgi:hypothetical protein